jgi:rubredoxin
MSSEVVEPVNLDRYECRACGYVYEPEKGDARSKVEANTPFTELPVSWRCPVCGAKTSAFANIGPAGTASGFKENYNYGLGVNVLTPGIKNVLIFGALGLGILFFLSLYSLN